MRSNILLVPSFWGADLKQKHLQVKEDNTKLVVLFPGKNYSTDKPVLYYAGFSSIQSGYDLLMLEYGYQAARTDLDIDDLPRIIEESIESIRQIINNYNDVVFISKSLGTIIAGEVHEKLGINIRHIYLTPIQGTIRYINNSEGIVIYGDNDEVFRKDLSKQINLNNVRKVIEIPNADHSLMVENPIESIEILKKLTTMYLDFLKD